MHLSHYVISFIICHVVSSSGFLVWIRWLLDLGLKKIYTN